ncbi:MAG: calcium/proton transporter [Methylobacterium sp.]|nr:calcium/proton transporter [Methylobacterium sp.]
MTTPDPRIAWLRRHAPVLMAWGIWSGLHFSGLKLHEIDHLLLLGGLATLIFMAMLASIFAVTRHAEHLAEQLREPLGTLVLTLSIALIEVSLMLIIMMGGQQNPTMLRDTVLATLMITLNGMVGLSLVAGGWRHHEQTFNLRGALAYLHLIAPISLILLVMPNRTLSSPGPSLIPVQEGFLGGLCVLAYALFLVMQTTRHKSLFDHSDPEDDLPRAPVNHAGQASRSAIIRSATGLVLAVAPIVLLAEFLGDFIDFGIEEMGAPNALGGFLIALLVLIPEGLGAYRAALANRMQRAVNICLGSALSTIALTVPVMLIAAGLYDNALILGLEGANSTLLLASIVTAVISLVNGRTSMLQGNVHVMLFFSYLFFIFYP